MDVRRQVPSPTGRARGCRIARPAEEGRHAALSLLAWDARAPSWRHTSPTTSSQQQRRLHSQTTSTKVDSRPTTSGTKYRHIAAIHRQHWRLFTSANGHRQILNDTNSRKGRAPLSRLSSRSSGGSCHDGSALQRPRCCPSGRLSDRNGGQGIWVVHGLFSSFSPQLYTYIYALCALCIANCVSKSKPTSPIEKKRAS